MTTTVLLKHRTSGDVFAARIDNHGKVTKSIGPLHYTDFTAALAGDADGNMHSEDNDWLNENDFELYAVTPPNPEQERADALAELSRRAREMPE